MSAREHILPVFVPHLGCPHDCVFCNQRRITSQQLPATAETVRRTIESAIVNQPEIQNWQLAFYGGSFTAIPAEDQIALLSVGKEYLDQGILSSIRLSTRPDTIDEAVLKRLQAYGVGTIELGAQSMVDAVLRRAGRGHTAQDVVHASELIRQYGFRLILQMMTGLPGDSGQESLETAKIICALRPDGVRIYPTVIVRDTALYDLWKAGKYTEHTVEDAVAVCAEIVPLFEQADIPVIRLGLNPTDELSAGAAVGGAYHPALGELVKSRVLRNRAEQLLAEISPQSKIRIVVPARLHSQMVGQRKCNVEWLKEHFQLSELKICSQNGINDIKIEKLSVEKGKII